MINPKKILIIKFKNIGDVLLTTPLISNLKNSFPSALIDIAVNSGAQEMVTLNPNLNEVIIYNRAKIKSLGLIKRVWTEIKFALNIRAKEYDLIINTTKGDRGNFLALISKAKTKIGYKSTNMFLKNVFDYVLPLHKMRHIIDIDLDSMRALNLPIINKKVEIFWEKSDEKKVDKLFTCKEFVHIHPVSRWLFKCLDDKTMAAIIDYYEIKSKTKVILTSAPIKKELNKIASILSHCKSKPINLSGKLSLKETAYLNSKAKFFVGVDTAIMHISVANDTPILAFFGPSASFHWGPWDNDLIKSEYRNQKGNQQMGKHFVYQKNWDCIPCKSDGCNGTKISDCLINLDIKKILKSINLK